MDNPYDENLVVQTGAAGREQLGPPGSVLPYAIASLVASTLWIYGFGSLFGIGFGVIALLQLPRGARGGRVARYLAWAGIVIGVLGIGLAVWVGRGSLA
jgi:Domain of unknown function (DUF4190)